MALKNEDEVEKVTMPIQYLKRQGFLFIYVTLNLHALIKTILHPISREDMHNNTYKCP